VINGHKHESFGCDVIDGRAFINAASSTALIVPARPAFVFDWSFDLDDIQIEEEKLNKTEVKLRSSSRPSMLMNFTDEPTRTSSCRQLWEVVGGFLQRFLQPIMERPVAWYGLLFTQQEKHSNMTQPAVAGSREIHVEQQALFAVGDIIKIGSEQHQITRIGSLHLQEPLANSYPAGTVVTKVEVREDMNKFHAAFVAWYEDDAAFPFVLCANYFWNKWCSTSPRGASASADPLLEFRVGDSVKLKDGHDDSEVSRAEIGEVIDIDTDQKVVFISFGSGGTRKRFDTDALEIVQEAQQWQIYARRIAQTWTYITWQTPPPCTVCSRLQKESIKMELASHTDFEDLPCQHEECCPDFDNLPGGNEKSAKAKWYCTKCNNALCARHEEEKLGPDNWLPRCWVSEGLLNHYQKQQDDLKKQLHEAEEANDEAQQNEIKKKMEQPLAEFDVAGPALLWGFRSINSWAASASLTVIAYAFTTKPKKDEVFSPCCWYVWIVFAFNFLYLLYYQNKVLSYVLLAQVQQLGRRFHFLGFKPSFRNWKRKMWLLTLCNSMDLANQCIFYGQFLRSSFENPDIQDVWTVTIHQSCLQNIPFVADINILFTVVWFFTFVQLIYLLMHCFTTEDAGISYEFRSMGKGYQTIISSVLPFTQFSEQKGSQFKFWHADILRVLSIYGRMPAVLWQDHTLTKIRLEKEKEEGNATRFLQILVNRLKENLFRLAWIDIAEKALKLEMQISIFCIDLCLQKDHSNFLIHLWYCNKQMLWSIVLAFGSYLYALSQHATVLNDLKFVFPKATHVQNQKDDSQYSLNVRTAMKLRLCYLFLVVCFLLPFIFHCVVKFISAFTCDYSMSNLISGCVTFNSTGPSADRSIKWPEYVRATGVIANTTHEL